MNPKTFLYGKITTGTYQCADYTCKDYSTLQGFIKGLKANKCPIPFNKQGLYFELEKGLIEVSWNYNGQKYRALIETE